MDRERNVFSLTPDTPTPPPEEFPAPAPENTPPPEEFPPPGGGGSAGEEDGSRRRRKKLLYGVAAAALLLLLAPGRGAWSAIRDLKPDLSLFRPEESAAPAPVDEPGQEPASLPEPTAEPEPTPEPEPGCEILYYCFSSAHYARLEFTRPEAFESVELELREPALDVQAALIRLGPEEIAQGVVDLTLPDSGDLYFERLDEYRAADKWPEELELTATLRYTGAEGSVTETRTLWPAPEQGWGLRYFAKDEEPSDYVFPGCFRFTTYESPTPVALALDDPAAAAPGVISVRFTIDGREIDPDTVTYSAWEEENAYFGPGTFYYARFVFPRPDWAPEEGVLHVTVTEYLVNFGEIIVIERDYPYSEEPSDLG